MARGGEPVVDGGADRAALDRRFAGAVVAGDQEKHTVAAADRLIERAVDRRPCRVEVIPWRSSAWSGSIVAGARSRSIPVAHPGFV